MLSSEKVDYLDKFILRLVNNAKYDEAIEYIDSILPDLQKIDNKRRELDMLIKKGAILSMMGEFFDAQDLYKKASGIALNLKCVKSEIKILHNSAIISDNFGDSNTAVFQYENALDLAVNSNLKKEIGQIKYNLGLVHYRIGNFKLATEYLKASQNIASQLDDFEGVILCRNVLGEITRKNGKPKKALSIHKNLLKKAKEHALTKRIFDIRRNILLDSFDIEKEESISKEMEDLLEQVEKIDARALYTQIVYDLTEMFFSLGEKEKAMQYLEIAEEWIKMRVRTFLLPSVYHLIANLNLFKGKRYYKRVEKYCNLALDWAEANSSIKEALKVYTLLGQLKLRTGHIKEATRYYEMANEKLILIDDEQIKDQIVNEYNHFKTTLEQESLPINPLLNDENKKIPVHF